MISHDVIQWLLLKVTHRSYKNSINAVTYTESMWAGLLNINTSIQPTACSIDYCSANAYTASICTVL